MQNREVKKALPKSVRSKARNSDCFRRSIASLRRFKRPLCPVTQKGIAEAVPYIKYNSRILRFPASGSPPQSSGGKPPRANEAFQATAMLRQNKMRHKNCIAVLPFPPFGRSLGRTWRLLPP